MLNLWAVMGVRMRSEPVSALLDREAERAALDGLLDLVAGAAGMRVARAAGVESEMELAFASLHLLCAPLLDRLGGLPGPQRDALGVAFGLRAGGAPDRFLVGLAVLTLLAEVEPEERPLLCVVDDAQWLDRASAQVLAFAARRLLAEPVGLIFAVREPGEAFGGLAELEVRGLPEKDARALLGSVVGFHLDERVRDRIVAETAGNPLALLELPRGLGAVQLAGGFGLPGAQPVPARIEQGFRRRLAALPGGTRSLLLVAAAEPAGDSLLVWRAAGRLGIPAGAAEAAQAGGLLEAGTRVRFRHPLVRSAVYSAASVPDRRAAHRVLAEVTDPGRDPDRRAWHLAAAAPGPDEGVAVELERSAGRAQARGGMAAAAAFLQRAVELTAEPAPRAGRALAAAQASLQAGAFDAAGDLLAAAAAGPLDELQQARASLLRGQIALAFTSSDAPALLVKAAQQLEPLDGALARQTYPGGLVRRDACRPVRRRRQSARSRPGRPVSSAARSRAPAAGSATRRAGRPGHRGTRPGGTLAEAGRAGLRRGRDHRRRGPAMGLAGHERRGHCMGGRVPACDGCPAAAVPPRGRLAGPSAELGAIDGYHYGLARLFCGGCFADRGGGGGGDRGRDRERLGPLRSRVPGRLRGAEAEAWPLIEAVTEDSQAAGQGMGVQWSQWVSAIVDNSLGRYEGALADARQAAEQAPELYISMWALPELIEAASRTGQTGLAAGALERLAEATSTSQTDWAQGVYARSRALLSDGQDAEGWYREAVGRLSRTRLRPELARAHLLYGEWLRRELRRADARAQLRTAHEMFAAIGMLAFAERARRELLATGETAGLRTAARQGELTPQEAQIARLARSGMSNPEIAAELFLSPHTVQYHLKKVFTKLEITSRRQLRQALPGRSHDGPVA